MACLPGPRLATRERCVSSRCRSLRVRAWVCLGSTSLRPTAGRRSCDAAELPRLGSVRTRPAGRRRRWRRAGAGAAAAPVGAERSGSVSPAVRRAARAPPLARVRPSLTRLYTERRAAGRAAPRCRICVRLCASACESGAGAARGAPQQPPADAVRLDGRQSRLASHAA